MSDLNQINMTSSHRKYRKTTKLSCLQHQKNQKHISTQRHVKSNTQPRYHTSSYKQLKIPFSYLPNQRPKNNYNKKKTSNTRYSKKYSVQPNTSSSLSTDQTWTGDQICPPRPHEMRFWLQNTNGV